MTVAEDVQKTKYGGGVVLTLLKILLALVSIFDIVLGLYVGYYYLSTGGLANSGGGNVYISTADGKYHYNPDCGIIGTSLEQAKLKGYEPCEKCAR